LRLASFVAVTDRLRYISPEAMNSFVEHCKLIGDLKR
jgi:hypothetical protein